MTSVSRNSAILEGLRRARNENRLHHAYILGGPEGGAKRQCVEQFAAEIFAEAGAGGLFGSAPDPAQCLRRVQQLNHPDFTVLQPVNEKIGVDEIRELPRLLAFAPLEAAKRIVLIEGAASMNAQAANALLKILEEPPGHTMFFLLCRDPAELLPTIVSRCQALRFAPMTDAELLFSVGESASADPAMILGFSEGSPERARALLAVEEGAALRRAAAENLLALWEASPRVPSAVAHWAETLEEEWSRVVVDSWAQLLRDFVFTLSGAGAQDLLFREFHPRLAALAQAPSVDTLWKEASGKSSSINRYRVQRDFNGNARLDLAALLVDLQIISVGKRV